VVFRKEIELLKIVHQALLRATDLLGRQMVHHHMLTIEGRKGLTLIEVVILIVGKAQVYNGRVKS
jgi:hypothetical protein